MDEFNIQTMYMEQGCPYISLLELAKLEQDPPKAFKPMRAKKKAPSSRVSALSPQTYEITANTLEHLAS